MSPSGDGWFGRPILRPAKEPPLPQIQHPAGHPQAKSRRIFRDFIDATAVVTIDSSTITVQFQKRAHNPHLLEAGFDRKRTRVPWLGGRHLQLIFG